MKLGVVMEGGASRTIFSCGVTDVLMEENIFPDYLVGVSAGIAYGMSYVSGQKGRNADLTEKYMNDPRYMGIRHWLNPKKRCYYNLDFAFDEVPNKLIPYDYEALKNYPGQTVAAVTNIVTGQPEYLDVPYTEVRWETVVASCSLPVLFPPVPIGGERYLDGGLSDPIPFKKAMEEGCDKILVILTRERDYVKSSEKGAAFVKMAYRKYPAIVELMQHRGAAYNALTKELFEEEKKGNVLVIAPRDTFGVGRTEGDWKKLGPLYQEGVDLTREMLPEIRAYLEA